MNYSLNLSSFETGIREQYVTVEHCMIAIQSAQENMIETYLFVLFLLVVIGLLFYKIHQLRKVINWHER
jgi:hypothetical protein